MCKEKIKFINMTVQIGDEFTSLKIFIEFATFLTFSSCQRQVHTSVETVTRAEDLVVALEDQFDLQFYNCNLQPKKTGKQYKA